MCTIIPPMVVEIVRSAISPECTAALQWKSCRAIDKLRFGRGLLRISLPECMVPLQCKFRGSHAGEMIKSTFDSQIAYRITSTALKVLQPCKYRDPLLTTSTVACQRAGATDDCSDPRVTQLRDYRRRRTRQRRSFTCYRQLRAVARC